MPTGIKAFLEPPGVCGYGPAPNTHNKKALRQTCGARKIPLGLWDTWRIDPCSREKERRRLLLFAVYREQSPERSVVPVSALDIKYERKFVFLPSYLRLNTTSTLSSKPLKLVDRFTYFGSNISSTESDNIYLGKKWITIDRLLIIWKSDIYDKMKLHFFQALAVSVLLYGCTT